MHKGTKAAAPRDGGNDQAASTTAFWSRNRAERVIHSPHHHIPGYYGAATDEFECIAYEVEEAIRWAGDAGASVKTTV